MMVPTPDLSDAHEEGNYSGAALHGIGLLGMAGLILFVLIGASLWTTMNRNSHVVKASQPVFLCMITVGCFLMGSLIIFLSLDDEVVSTNVCSAFYVIIPWLGFIDCILTFLALFTKANWVNQIFHNPTCKKIIFTAGLGCHEARSGLDECHHPHFCPLESLWNLHPGRKKAV
jgi:hypothetical protein